MYTLSLNQIVYFESINRKVIIHTTTKEEYEYYGTLKDVVERLYNSDFVQVHNSYVVNMEHIETMSGEGLLLNSGEQIIVTRSYNKDFQSAYRNFVMTRIR